MNYSGRDLNMWKEVIKKAVDAEVEANLPPPLAKKINSMYPKSIVRWPKRQKRHLLGVPKRFSRIRKKPSFITPLLLISLRPKTFKSITTVSKKAV